MQDRPDLVAAFQTRIPIGCGAQVDDISGAIVVLSRDDAVMSPRSISRSTEANPSHGQLRLT